MTASGPSNQPSLRLRESTLLEPTSWIDQGSSGSAPSSLLERAKLRDEQAWVRLVHLFGPVVYRWARIEGLQSQDAIDVVQDVFASLIHAIGHFRRDRPGDSFRAWLRTITRNKIRDQARRRKARPEAAGGSQAAVRLECLVDPRCGDSAEDDSDLDAAVLHRALELVRAEFEPRTWQAFWLTVVEDKPPTVVAEELGVSIASVYQAKSRVLRRLRAELDGLFEV